MENEGLVQIYCGPVSYTHLDVYKRQGKRRETGKRCGSLLLWGRRAAGRVIHNLSGSNVWEVFFSLLTKLVWLKILKLAFVKRTDGGYNS